MVTCLLLYYSTLFNITTIHSLAVGNSVPFYLAATVLLLTISALPYRFLAVFYLVTATTVGESFDASSIHPSDLPLLFPALYLFLSSAWPVFKSKRFVTAVLVIDVTQGLSQAAPLRQSRTAIGIVPLKNGQGDNLSPSKFREKTRKEAHTKRSSSVQKLQAKTEHAKYILSF